MGFHWFDVPMLISGRPAMSRRFVPALLILSLAAACSAATFDVPIPYATIQAGIDAAADGDTIRVAAGVYSGPGNCALEITGEDKVLLAEAGPTFTTIDCGQQDVGLTIWDGPTAATVVSGFTITQASGGNGAGIVISEAAATIEHCRFTDCHATLNGDAMYIGYNTGTVVVRDCLITGCSGEFRGAITVDHAQAEFEYCLFHDNLSRQMGGSALFNNHGTVNAVHCTLEGNETLSGEGAVSQYGATTNLTNCIVAFTVTGCATSGGVSAEHCLSFGNEGGDALDGLGENLYLDPHFCDAENHIYTLCANSPCDAGAPANPWGEQVGVLAAGCPACPPTPTDHMSWSEVKSLYGR